MYRSCRKHSISLHTICTVNKLLFATRQRAAGLTPAFITQRHAPKEQINEEPKTKTYARNFTLWNSYDTLPSRQMKTKRLPNIIFYHRTICGTSFNVAHMLFRSYFFCRSWPEIMFFNAGGTVPCYASTSLGFKSHGTVACHEAIRFVTRTAECFTRNMASKKFVRATGLSFSCSGLKTNIPRIEIMMLRPSIMQNVLSFKNRPV